MKSVVYQKLFAFIIKGQGSYHYIVYLKGSCTISPREVRESDQNIHFLEPVKHTANQTILKLIVFLNIFVEFRSPPAILTILIIAILTVTTFLLILIFLLAIRDFLAILSLTFLEIHTYKNNCTNISRWF